MSGKIVDHAEVVDVAESAVASLTFLWPRLHRQGIIESVESRTRLTEPVVILAVTVPEVRELVAELDREGLPDRVRELAADLREMVEGAPGYVP